MIGLGIWNGSVRFMMTKIPFRVQVSDSDTLAGSMALDVIGGRAAQGRFVFKGDRMDGEITVPVMGGITVRIKDAVREQGS